MTLTLWICAALAVVVTAILVIGPLRRKLVSDRILAVYRKLMPPMSQTEREALEAGTVWWDGELFSGRPDWKRLLESKPPTLTAEEQRFLDEEASTLCAMANDWDASSTHRDLPPHVWQYIKDKGFFGMIIPKQY